MSGIGWDPPVGWKDGGIGWGTGKNPTKENDDQGPREMSHMLAADRGDDPDQQCQPGSPGEVVGGPQGLREEVGGGAGRIFGGIVGYDATTDTFHRHDTTTGDWATYVRYTGGQADR